MGLNISIYNDSFLERKSVVPEGEGLSGDGGDKDTSSDEKSPVAEYTGLRLDCGLKNAIASSNDGVYVVRPTGASLQNIELSAGTYALVPSTFDPLCCKYELVVYLSPSSGPRDCGFFVKRLR